MKRIYLLLLCIFAFLGTEKAIFAQQLPQYSLYMLNRMAYNPAWAGSEKSLSAVGVFRRQWAGLNGSPQTQHFNAHLPIYFLSSGVGLSVENEGIGARRLTTLKGTWAYRKQMGDDGFFAAGASVGFLQNRLDITQLKTPEGTDGNPNDPILLSGTAVNGLGMTYDIGVAFENEVLNFGIASQNITESVIKYQDVTTTYTLKRNYTASVGANFDVGDFNIRPSALYKTDLAAMQAELSVMVKYNDNFFLGGGYRGFSPNTFDAISIFGGFNLNTQFRVAYNYDLGLSNIKKVSEGTHEFTILYNLGKEFGKGKVPPIIYNPRYY